MRMSDWSSYVGSSDLLREIAVRKLIDHQVSITASLNLQNVGMLVKNLDRLQKKIREIHHVPGFEGVLIGQIHAGVHFLDGRPPLASGRLDHFCRQARFFPAREDRKRVVSGKSVSVSVDLGCRRIIK